MEGGLNKILQAQNPISWFFNFTPDLRLEPSSPRRFLDFADPNPDLDSIASFRPLLLLTVKKLLAAATD